MDTHSIEYYKEEKINKKRNVGFFILLIIKMLEMLIRIFVA